MKTSFRFSSGLLAMAITAASGQALAADDDLLWLESPHDAKALDWARAATAQTRQQLGASPSHAAVAGELKAILAQPPAEPDQYLLGERVVRFFRDAAHPYGLLQTAPRSGAGVKRDWKTVLDVAALRQSEGIPFELQVFTLGSACLAPTYTRCLLRLSPGGGDEVEIREFDIGQGAFVADGFKVGKSRAFAEWMGPDTLLVASALNDAPKTLAGWPAVVNLWSRGTPLASAKPVYQAQASDAIVQFSTVGNGADTLGVIGRAIDYSTFEVVVVDAQGKQTKLPFPQALKPFGVLGASARHVIAQLAHDETIEGRPYKAETVIAYDTSASAKEGQRVSAVYVPAAGEFVDPAFGGLAVTRDDVLLLSNRNLRQRVVAARFEQGRWKQRQVFEAQPGETVTVRSDGHDSNEFIASVAGFVTPRSQYLINEKGQRTLLAQDPVLMDGSGYTTEIGSATSRDGTSIDYFLLKPRKPAAGPQPLLMTGYGAFGLSMRPGYFDAFVGGPALKLWLERGGAIAIPAIRGGGERGAAWHMAAIREKRQNSYDDFIAVTEHLIKTGFTSADHVGIFGMSNGGLLTATLGTQRPDLFGAVVSDVPLTDLIRMRHMGMGAAWMNEYGNPDDPAQTAAMLKYSPYQNVRKGTKYPPFLVTISTEDNRVGPGHARKLAWRLQQAGATTYFYEDEEGGHGVSDAFRNPELMALRMSFLIDNLMGQH
ncbi:prolyl oligopeptidase family serine peptidase [Pseudoxanthomonas indica]|uniref:prolyl oligopeptidase n=1 Tax=Pseudoxanthomonas indica TaxID=428993 RepID=A0A1T5LMZ6_9GAMM|nr:prolyl oligopeptidase family serine peptidase [Pseudoxanthomonas indica]GGD37106.1 prolyl oligopeptidase [Pseudoxanthomonas indica]SKC77294.1 prolyl oligopeptidase [Pseudoxanthomonas indica]